jgi:hypothetical protein
VDFKKAFDLVDHDLLLCKLGNYGFNMQAVSLIRNYFSNRSVSVKIGDTFSIPKKLELGVPQGLVLGPLLFLIFINDLPYAIFVLIVKMFADDTTIYAVGPNLETTLEIFSSKIGDFISWRYFNRMDINWSKTKVMFMSRRIISTSPGFVQINNHHVEVVNRFKLLGVEIDSNLKFKHFVSNICKSVNKRLFAIKRLFFLSHRI